MKMCKSMFHDINFEPDAIQPCCDVHGIKVPRYEFNGGKFNMKNYCTYIQDIFTQIQSQGEICQGCPHLMEVDKDNSACIQMLFNSVTINVHRFLCNCKCIYCNLWKNIKKYDYDFMPVVNSLFFQNILSKDCYFSWGGGESTIFNQFDEICNLISHKGYIQYVHTNGIRFSKSLDNILHNNLGKINISLDSGTPHTYKEIKGVDKFDQVVENIRRYRMSSPNGYRVELKYIVFEKNNNLQEIEKFVELCNSLDIKFIEYSLNFREVNGNGPSQQTLYAAAYLKKLAEEAKSTCIPFFITPPWIEQIDKIKI